MILNKQKRKKKESVKLLKPVQISKQEKKENYVYFNVIKGVILKLNIIKNEFDDYILVLKCLSYKSLKYMISNMSEFQFKEIQIFVKNKEYYASLKFDKKYVKENQNKKFKNTIKELELRKTEFKVLNIYEIISLLREKVYRNDTLKNAEIRKFFKIKNGLELLQNKLFAKKVLIKNDFIYFNYEKIENNDTKHKIIGLQMYPSYLYEGFLTEINHLDDIETTTYIRTVNLDKVKENLKQKENHIIDEYISSLDRLYNTCFYIHLWGTEEEINAKKKVVLDIANKYHVIINEFFMQQKRAFCAFLPLMNNNIKCYRAISNINGILPYNEDLIKVFKCNMKYGTELLSNKTLYYNRDCNGIVLSSEKESKRRFIQNEKNYIAVDLRLVFKTIDFAGNDNDSNNFKILFNSKSQELTDEDLYKIFKMYCLLCIGAYRDNRTVDVGDKELLFDKIDKIQERKSEYNYQEIKEILFSQLEKNRLLYNKINKYIDAPTDDIKRSINNIISIYKSFYNENKEYIYIYNIQEIIHCLSILLKDIFERETKSIYLLSSYNDFQLYNNVEVANIIFKAPYINIIDIKPNDLVIINNYLNLPNSDLVHLRDKRNITGSLYTNICEFNYFIERNEEEDDL